jgi:FkbM family methyltransferase
MALKTDLRELIPKRAQVPIKYYTDKFRGNLEPELSLLPHLINKGDKAIDIGANRGSYVYKLYQIGASVDSYEPNPSCASVLIEWSKGKQSIKVYQVALSSEPGTAMLHIPCDSSGLEHDSSGSLNSNVAGHSRAIAVTKARLDDINLTPVALVKIDVEGHEHDVITGSLQTIRDFRPSILVEIESRHSIRPIHETFALIKSLGYEGFFLDHDCIRNLSSFKPEKHQVLDSKSLPLEPYVNNFLFLAKNRLMNYEYNSLFSAFGSRN